MSLPLRRSPALNAAVIKLGIVSFLADVSSEMLYPITPIFLTAVLGASMASVGLIEGSAEAIASILKAYGGRWSDRAGKRKPFIVAGYALAALAKPLIGMAGSWPMVLVARGLDRTGKGLRSAPRDALLTESVAVEKRGEAFGWHRAMDTLGAALGPLLALGVLHLNANELRPLYFWSLIPGGLAVLATLTLRDSHPPKEGGRSVESAARPSFRWSQASPGFRVYLFSWSLFSLGNSSDAFLILKVRAEGHSLTETILMYCFYNLFYAVSSPYLGRLSDHLRRTTVLKFGLVAFALVYAGFSVAHSAWQFWALFAIYGLYMGATDGIGKALIVDLAPKKAKASALGIFAAVSGVCTIVASAMMGYLWEHAGVTAAFAFAAGAAVLSVLALSVMDRKIGSSASVT